MANHPYIEAVLNYVEKYYQDDIDLVVLYGSHLRGDNHKKSDIDLFYVPNNENGFKAAFTVIINEIGYDFFPITWDRLTSIANEKQSLLSLINDGKIIYNRNNQVLEKYAIIKNSAKDYTNKTNLMENKLNLAKQLVFDYPKQNAKIIKILTETIAIYNDTYLQKGIINFENELENLEKPDNFIEMIKEIIDNPHEVLVKDFIKVTEAFVLKPNPNHRLPGQGFYEEMKSIYQKALQTNDPYKAYFIKDIIESETLEAFSEDYGFPKLLDDYKLWIKEHEAYMIKILNDNAIDIKNFPDLETFEKDYLKTK